MGGAMTVPRTLKTEQNKIFCLDRPNKKKNIYDPFIFANNRFS
jgi:hypothetical protein